jgi:glycosyltransferase involved in cell wall biosynthesis
MRVLFIHQNMPGQFKHLAPELARDPANHVAFMTRRADTDLPGVRRITYAPRRSAHASTHRYVDLYENCVLLGQQVVRRCQDLARTGNRPDVVVAHPGWGESLFIKDVFPQVALLSYCEFYYHGRGADVGFDPAFPADLDTRCRTRARNASFLLSLESCDRGLSPTNWQRDQHPRPFREKIDVIFDGIDTGVVRPDPVATFTLPSGRVLTGCDSVVTYVARNLEPYRGFPSFMRAIPSILARSPEAQIVIVGGDEISYGNAPKDGGTWRESMLGELGGVDPERVHFVGRIPYRAYLSLLQVSSAHVYLTVPFVLSWSFMEALAAGCVVVASRTPPVEEMIEDGRNGFLVDFFSPAEIAERVIHALTGRDGLDRLRTRARATVLGQYDLATCLPRQVGLVRSLA